MRRLLYLTFVIAVLLAGCRENGGKSQEASESLTAEADESWNIPFLCAVSGEISYVGEAAKWAAEYAQETINTGGGIANRPINIEIKDTRFDSGRMLKFINELDEDTLVLTGPIDSPGAEAAGPEIQSSKITNLAAYSTASLRESSVPYGVSYMSDSEEGDWLAVRKWIELNEDITKVAVFACPTDPSQMATVRLLEQNLVELGVEVCPVIEVKSGSADILAEVIEALNYKVDGYISLLRSEEYTKVLTQLRTRGVTEGRRVTATFSCYADSMFEKAGEYLDGTYIWNKLDPDYDGEEWHALAAVYQKDAGTQANISTIPDTYNMFLAIKQCYEELGITGEEDQVSREREEIAAWFYNSPVVHGIQGDFQWVNGKKISEVYYFQFDKNKPAAVQDEA